MTTIEAPSFEHLINLFFNDNGFKKVKGSQDLVENGVYTRQPMHQMGMLWVTNLYAVGDELVKWKTFAKLWSWRLPQRQFTGTNLKSIRGKCQRHTDGGWQYF